MKNKISIALLGALALTFLLTSTVFASDIYEDKIIFGDDFTLASGQTINGSLIVFGGNVTIEKGATVTENVVVFGGNVQIAGDVKEDVVIFGGNADLLSTAVINGRLVTTGGNISRKDGATVKGGETQGYSQGNFPLPIAPSPRVGIPIFDPIYLFAMQGARSLGMAFALGIIALVVASLWAQPLHRVTTTITATPAAAGGLGLLTLIAGVVLMILTAITLCLSPVSALIAIVYVLAIIFGWVALGTLIGERLVTTFNWTRLSPAVAAGLGTMLVSLVSTLVGLVLCLGPMINIALASIGMGAVVLTRFGSRLYPLGTTNTVTPPSTPNPDSSNTPTAIA